MSDTKQRPKCQDCERESNPAYDMDFTDINEGFIYWCDEHGPLMHKLNRAINNAFDTRPDFAETFAKAIAEVNSN